LGAFNDIPPLGNEMTHLFKQYNVDIHLFIMILVLCTPCFSAFSKDIKPNQWHPFYHLSTYHWQVTQQQQLYIQHHHSLSTFDLSNCRFCRGKDDGCHATGIQAQQFSFYPNPVLIAVCQTGAHSMKLMIFDPLKNQHEAIYQTYGVYYLNYALHKNHLDIRFDGRKNTCDTDICFQEKTVHWPISNKH